MSRYELTPRPEALGVARVVIGWDRPLRTFYVQVFGPRDADGEEVEILWIGAAPGELARVEDALALVRPHAEISDDLATLLEADRRDGHDHRDGPAQIEARRFLHRP